MYIYIYIFIYIYIYIYIYTYKQTYRDIMRNIYICKHTYNILIYTYVYIQWGEINTRTYENFYFLSFKYGPNKNFIYIYCIRIYSTNMSI